MNVQELLESDFENDQIDDRVKHLKHQQGNAIDELSMIMDKMLALVKKGIIVRFPGCW
jgi:hypothetical protein